MTQNSPPRLFGISYPIRKGRILLSTLLLFVVLYFLGSILILIPALFFVSAYGSAGWLITAILITSGITLIAYRGYRKTLRGVLADAEEVTTEKHPNLERTLDLVKEEANKRGMEPPTLYIHPEPSVNALAIGRRNNGNIIIFDGLLTQVDSLEELNAIVGHELAHLDNRDSTLMATLTGIKQTIVSTWTWFGYSLRKGLTEFSGVDMTPVAKQNLKQNMRRRSELLCSPIGLCEKSISRHREYIADAEGARIAGPDAMVNALNTIGDSDQEFQEIDVSQSLCIYGLNSGLFSQLRSTHPPVEKRVRYIQKTCAQD